MISSPASPRQRARRALPLPDPADVERTLAQLATQITGAESLSETHRAQLAILHALVQPRACFVASYSPERKLLQVVAVRGRNDERIAAAAPGEGPVGKAFSEAKIVREEGLLAAPLSGRHGPEGCLVLLGPKVAVSDSLMESLAAHLSAGSEIARLSDEATRRTRDLETAVAGLRSLERTREELLANISHDLKNPLTTVKTYLTLLGRQNLGELSERQRKAVATCHRNADRLLRMINDLLLVSRLQTGDMELADRPFGLKALAEEAVRALSSSAEQAGVRLALPPCPEAFIRGDRSKLLEAASNLIESGIHRSEEGGEVEIRVGPDESGLAVLSVRDHGAGIDELELPHLFDTYFRPSAEHPLRRAGGGLGLPAAAKVIHLHGGRVEAASKAGEGSILKVFLPMFAGAVSPAEAAHEPRTGGILLVEDDADCREVLIEVLELEGYRVIPAASATKARALLAQLRPALVLLDLRLSEEDGMSVLHHIRATPALADVAVYIISGARDTASLSAGRGLDRIDGFFEKPLQLARVLDTIAAVVRPTRAMAGS